MSALGENQLLQFNRLQTLRDDSASGLRIAGRGLIRRALPNRADNSNGAVGVMRRRRRCPGSISSSPSNSPTLSGPGFPLLVEEEPLTPALRIDCISLSKSLSVKDIREEGISRSIWKSAVFSDLAFAQSARSMAAV